MEEIETYDRNLYIAYTYHHSMYRAMKAAEEAEPSPGSGGASSLGGGGGFSGGGSAEDRDKDKMQWASWPTAFYLI